jgi:glycosyltransferase involved in cell wall biosynthesis
MGNAAWMTAAWSLLALNPRLRPQVLIVGTDPVFSPFVALAWALFRPRLRLAHWCFDLYPDAAIADGLLNGRTLAVRFLKQALRLVYKRFHLVVDIGSCMRRCLRSYLPRAAEETIVPWALVEYEQPPATDAEERRRLFGDASLGLLYSGNFGRAHTWRGIPEMAQALENCGGRVVFAIRGNVASHLRSVMQAARAPIAFSEFTSTERLGQKLSAADIHIVTLRDEWTGTVVPSKFFGALAIGRPVLFVGSPDSAIAQWIRRFDVGWILTPENIQQLAIDLPLWAGTPGAKARVFEHCHSVYQRHFSRAMSLDRWDLVLRELVRI